MTSPQTNNPLFTAKIRIARPTPSIPALLPFYTDGLGFHITSSFTAHNGFDGVMLGHPSLPYHLEFTTQAGHENLGRAPSKDNLLVFYLPEKEGWDVAVKRMEDAGYVGVKSENPWWDQKGKTYEDADGWRVVFWQGAWEK